MHLQALYDFIFSFRPLPAKLLDLKYRLAIKYSLEQNISEIYYSTRQLILSAGQVSGHLYFINKGLARQFYYDKEIQKEKTSFLWSSNSIVTEIDSFYKQRPSKSSIEVMPGSELLSITYEQLMQCTALLPEVATFSLNIALEYYSYYAMRNLDLRHLSAWERYVNLLKTHRDIEQLVSKEVIASYLNITPQSLSRLLKKRRHP